MEKTGQTLTLDAGEAVTFITQIGLNVPKLASSFMSYGLNSSYDSPNSPLSLPGFMQFVEPPDDLSENDRDNFLEKYRSWIIGNGFRELIDGLDTILNHLIPIIAKVERYGNDESLNKADKFIKAAERGGVSKKLEMLEERFGFKTGMERHYRTLNRARNCLTHRAGIVDDKDCDELEFFELTWLGLEAYHFDSKGNKSLLTHDALGPYHGEDGAKIDFTYINKAKSFSKGERINLHPKELQEICLMTSYVFAKLHQLSINWFLDHGIFVNGGKYIDEPGAELISVYTKNK